MRDGSILAEDRRYHPGLWRVWPDGRTRLINDPNFVQERMDFYETDKNHPDAATYRALDFAANFFVTVLVGITLVLVILAIVSAVT